MSNTYRPKTADRIQIGLLGLIAEIPLLACPLMVWPGRPWAPSWWADAALYATAALTALGALLAMRRPVTGYAALRPPLLILAATVITAVTALTLLSSDTPELASSGTSILFAALFLALLRRQVSLASTP